MRRVVSLIAVALLAVLGVGCAETGVGDPCVPVHPAFTGNPGEHACAAGGPDAGCFVGGEVYIETRSLQCRTRVCMVYHWDEFNAMEERNLRVYCTCRCGGEGDPSTFCSCPSGFVCATAFVAGEPGIRGNYCVRSDTPGIGDAGH
jgi:hypothetical protein